MLESRVQSSLGALRGWIAYTVKLTTEDREKRIRALSAHSIGPSAWRGRSLQNFDAGFDSSRACSMPDCCVGPAGVLASMTRFQRVEDGSKPSRGTFQLRCQLTVSWEAVNFFIHVRFVSSQLGRCGRAVMHLFCKQD